MANVTGTGTSFNLPNFAGELFTASPTKTPFLSMIGGLSGGRKTESDEFATVQLYEFPEAAQPAISEQASETAPAATALVREQKTNVTQIFQESIVLTYAKLANRGKLSGLNTAGQAANPASELDWQIARRLEKIARDVEHTFLNGTYNKAADASQANKTRGMFELCSTGTTIAAGDQPLSVDLLKQLFRAMSDAGAAFENMVLFCGADQKQRITALYEKQLGYNTPAARNVAGMNITKIETDFFEMGGGLRPLCGSGPDSDFGRGGLCAGVPGRARQGHPLPRGSGQDRRRREKADLRPDRPGPRPRLSPRVHHRAGLHRPRIKEAAYV